MSTNGAWVPVGNFCRPAIQLLRTSERDMSHDIETRRRRALYRAQHRGTKELDIVIGGYAEAKLAGMEEDELALFERFLQLPEPDIEAAVFGRRALSEAELQPLIGAIRSFHGVDARLG